MKWLAAKRNTIFLGQGITKGDRVYHTMDDVPKKKCLEQPICENLTLGLAIGLAIKGYRPVVIFQRMDFMLIAADQIINHLALIPEMSNYQYRLPIIIRTCVGSRDPKFDVGRQHNHDFRHIFTKYICSKDYRHGIYRDMYGIKYPCIITEERDKYATETV